MVWPDVYHYAIPFFTLILSGFALPVPEEMVLTAAGVLCGRDAQIYWQVMIPVCILGIAIGDSALYFIGWMWGAKLVEKAWIKRKFLSEEKRHKIKQNYNEYGLAIVLFARIVPGVRTPVFLMAGILKLKFLRFMLMDAVCSIPGTIIFFSLGYWFTDQFLAALERVEGNRPLVMVVVLAAIGGYVLYSLKSRKVATGDPSSIPMIGGQLGSIAHHQHARHETEPSQSGKVELVEFKVLPPVEPVPKPVAEIDSLPPIPPIEKPLEVEGCLDLEKPKSPLPKKTELPPPTSAP